MEELKLVSSDLSSVAKRLLDMPATSASLESFLKFWSNSY